MSYRNRGYDPRTHNIVMVNRINKENEIRLLIEFMNKIIEIRHRIIMLEYSAKKINANHPPIYSTLKPDTNSDSPSAKSNGLRFTSAKHLVNHRKKIIIFPQINHIIDWDLEIIEKW